MPRKLSTYFFFAHKLLSYNSVPESQCSAVVVVVVEPLYISHFCFLMKQYH